MEGYDIGAFKQFFQRNILRLQAFYRIGVITDHLHLKSIQYPDHGLPDLSCPYHTCRLFVEIHAHQAVQAHIEIPGPVVRLVGKPGH